MPKQKSQKGISIFIVIVVMTVLLGIGFGLNSIFVRQLKNLRNIGDSVIALYAADAGIERILRVDICMTTATSLIPSCIADTINAPAPASCSDPINEALCRQAAIVAIPLPPADQVLSNEATYELNIDTTPEAGCGAANYCGQSTGIFNQATRKVEILR